MQLKLATIKIGGLDMQK